MHPETQPTPRVSFPSLWSVHLARRQIDRLSLLSLPCVYHEAKRLQRCTAHDMYCDMTTSCASSYSSAVEYAIYQALYDRIENDHHAFGYTSHIS
ncbi:hypothetical protein IG631_09930 [Alternaria alternata]|nr:hypothetical protein IG631_09930 [Alternaria alternata]